MRRNNYVPDRRIFLGLHPERCRNALRSDTSAYNMAHGGAIESFQPVFSLREQSTRVRSPGVPASGLRHFCLGHPRGNPDKKRSRGCVLLRWALPEPVLCVNLRVLPDHRAGHGRSLRADERANTWIGAKLLISLSARNCHETGQPFRSSSGTSVSRCPRWVVHKVINRMRGKSQNTLKISSL